MQVRLWKKEKLIDSGRNHVSGSSPLMKRSYAMIEESEKLKSTGGRGKQSIWQTDWFPIPLAGTGSGLWLSDKKCHKGTVSVLMVDFSCALKLAMPISVLSAIREANQYKITVKGGKYHGSCC